MSWPVFTERFGGLSDVTTGVHLIGTVPAGRAWILTDVDAEESGGSGGTIYLLLGAYGPIKLTTDATDSASLQWRGRQRLYAGEELQAYVDSGTWRLLATGYELSAS